MNNYQNNNENNHTHQAIYNNDSHFSNFYHENFHSPSQISTGSQSSSSAGLDTLQFSKSNATPHSTGLLTRTSRKHLRVADALGTSWLTVAPNLQVYSDHSTTSQNNSSLSGIPDTNNISDHLPRGPLGNINPNHAQTSQFIANNLISEAPPENLSKQELKRWKNRQAAKRTRLKNDMYINSLMLENNELKAQNQMIMGEIESMRNFLLLQSVSRE